MTAQYRILKYRSVPAGDFVQIAVYSYDTDEDKPTVYIGFIDNWVRVNSAARDTSDPIFENLLGAFLRRADNKTLLQEIIEAPDSVFMFMPPVDSSSPAETLAEEIAATLIVE